MRSISAGLWSLLGTLLIFPLAHALVVAIYNLGFEQAALYGFLLAALLLLAFSLRAGSTAQEILGGVAGLFFWSAIGEIAQGGELYKQPAVWGVVLIVFIYLLGRPESRCDMVRFLRRLLRLPSDEPHPGWHAPAIAFEFFFLVWTGHMLMLLSYYDPALGVRSWLTYTILIVSALATPFLIYLQVKTTTFDLGIARAIPTMVIAWMWVEVLIKWEAFTAPWAPLNWPVLGVLVLLLVATVACAVLIARRRVARPLLDGGEREP